VGGAYWKMSTEPPASSMPFFSARAYGLVLVAIY
jgi:hypothetical protein